MVSTGQAFSATELWAISFGNGGSAGSTDTLFFTAGLANNTNGLFGAISVPEPSSAVLGLIAVGMMAGGWQLKNRRRLRSGDQERADGPSESGSDRLETGATPGGGRATSARLFVVCAAPGEPRTTDCDGELQ